MEIEHALGAARRLSVDVANLSFRLALLDTEHDLLRQLAMPLMPGTWKRSMHPVISTDLVHDPDDTTMTTVEQTLTITGEQVAILDALLMALSALE